MTTPRVSILMPAYNASPYVGLAVESLLGQTFADFELIAVDDGSTDGTGVLLADYARRDARIVLLPNAANIGYTRSLNTALGAARGELLARQDADDISLPERLARQVAFLDQNPLVGVVGTLNTHIDAQGQPLSERNFAGYTDNVTLQAQLMVDFCLLHPTVLMRRSLVQAVGGYNPDMEPAEDHDLWLRLAEITQFANLPDVLYLYRQHPASVSGTRLSSCRLKLAESIERAARRRFGEATPPGVAANLGRAYLKAALAAYAAGDPPEAQRRRQQAEHWAPGLLAGPEPLTELLSDLAAPLPPEAGARLYRDIFAGLLPPSAGLARLHSQQTARLYMRRVFAASAQRQYRSAGRHLWPALRHDPSWLLNRGVLSIALRAVLAQAQPAGRPNGGG